MRTRENYTPFMVAGLILTVASLIVFQIYIWLEPTRIQAVQAADQSAAVADGRALFAASCANCHGTNGEGKIGRAINSRDLLTTTSDQTFFGLISTGVPGTLMPAWGQPSGGPFTDQQISQLVAFIRAWEPTAPQSLPVVNAPDPARGAAIFANTCSICHGENGQGTQTAPAINDAGKLKDFDDAWYRDTISHGRPAKGMPTWGTVLSPQQINDLVALMAAWRQGKQVTASSSLATQISNALFAIRQFDKVDAGFYLSAALPLANDSQAREIKAVLDLVKANHLSDAETRLIALLPPSEIGKELYASNCAPCHADDGSGGMGKNLRSNKFIQSQNDQAMVSFLLAGRKGTAMDGFKNVLTEEQLNYIVALLRTWQK